MKKVIVNFFKNIKDFGKYLMKVDFKALFANTIILLCMLIIAAFAYIPVGIIEDLIRSFIVVFAPFGGVFELLYSWIFKVIGALCSIYAFMWLFNFRYNYIENDVTDPFNGSIVKKAKENTDKEELDLPKVKEKEEK